MNTTSDCGPGLVRADFGDLRCVWSAGGLYAEWSVTAVIAVFNASRLGYCWAHFVYQKRGLGFSLVRLAVFQVLSLLLLGSVSIIALCIIKLLYLGTQMVPFDTAPTILFYLQLMLSCLGFIRAHWCYCHTTLPKRVSTAAQGRLLRVMEVVLITDGLVFVLGLSILAAVSLLLTPSQPQLADSMLVATMCICFYHLIYATLVLIGFYNRFIRLIDVGLANRSDPIMEDLKQRLVRYRHTNGRFVVQTMIVSSLAVGWTDFRRMAVAYLAPLPPLFVGFSTLAYSLYFWNPGSQNMAFNTAGVVNIVGKERMRIQAIVAESLSPPLALPHQLLGTLSTNGSQKTSIYSPLPAGAESVHVPSAIAESANAAPSSNDSTATLNLPLGVLGNGNASAPLARANNGNGRPLSAIRSRQRKEAPPPTDVVHRVHLPLSSLPKQEPMEPIRSAAAPSLVSVREPVVMSLPNAEMNSAVVVVAPTPAADFAAGGDQAVALPGTVASS